MTTTGIGVTAPATPPAPGVTVRFGRRQSRGLLLGFTGPRLACLAAAVAVLVAAMVLAGGVGLVVSAPVWAGLVAAVFLRWNGQTLIEASPVAGQWAARRAAGQTRYRTRPTSPRPAGTLALPGDAAALRFHVDADTGAVMVHDPHRRTLTAIVAVSHPAFVLRSPDEQARRVAAWSRVLAGAAASGSCAGIQILESSFPDPGDAVRDWYTAHGTGTEDWPNQEYRALLRQSALASCTHRSLIALSLDLKRTGRAARAAAGGGVGGGLGGAAQLLRTDMAACEMSLRAADLRVHGWLQPGELATAIRHAYDPAMTLPAERSPAERDAGLASAGPVAVDEHWDHLRHDNAYSAVLWISEWPRIDVAPHFLHALVFLQDVRRSLSVVARPLPAGEALRGIRREKVEYLTEAQQNARIGKIADLAAEQEYADVLTREHALIAGHADLRFSGFLTVTAPTRDALTSAVAAAQRAGIQCGCDTRLLFGQQAQAFTVAALPLGRGVH